MKTTIILLALTVIFCSCHKTLGTSKRNTPNKLLIASFPGIDTATMWNMVYGQRTGGKALISSSGQIQLVGYAGSRGNYTSGTYYTAIPDTAIVTGFISFPVLDSKGDTISKDNFLECIPTTGWARAYYYLKIDGGNLPGYSIVQGYFVDSI